MTPTAQVHAEQLACSIASAEDGIAWAQALRSAVDMARVVAKARADNLHGLSAERIQADLQWRDLTLATIDLHLEELQLEEKLERIRGELITRDEEDEMTTPPPDPVDQAIKEYWASHATLAKRLGESRSVLTGYRLARISWWRWACARAGEVLVAAGYWLIERES